MIVKNDGPLIAETDYWQTEAASEGKILVSLNAGAFRVLLPRVLEHFLEDMGSAKEVVISRGPWPAAKRADAFELLFDDGSDDPFALHLSVESFDVLPAPEDMGRECVCSVWTDRRGTPHKSLQRTAYYRKVTRIPCLKPWPKRTKR